MEITRYLLFYCCVFAFSSFLISACNCLPDQAIPVVGDEMVITMNMDLGKGMMGRHHADIPNLFAGLVSPVDNDDDQSIERGKAIYHFQCESCHGENGLGDGAAGINLDPAPAQIGRTSLMLSDEYLFWRISEGGVPFGTAMPSFESILDEGERWDVINYLRHLGFATGTMDDVLDPSFSEQSKLEHVTMVEEAIQLKLITPEEGEIFLSLHAFIETFIVDQPDLISPAGMDEHLIVILDTMVADGVINQEQAEIFITVHARLNDSGLMR